MEKIHHLPIDALRIISILAVVLIHTTTRTFEVTSSHLLFTPWTLFLNQSSRFAVPLFFLISGFVLEISYPFHSNPFSYLQRRLSKIFVPYLFWSAIYYYFIYRQHNISYLKSLLTGSASYQLYFIPTLLIFYLIFPLIHKYYRFIFNKIVLPALLILQIYFLVSDYYYHSIVVFYPVAIAMFNFFPFLLGIFVSHHHDHLLTLFARFKPFLITITLLLMGFVSYEGASRYLQTGNYLSFYSQWRPSVLVYTFLVGWSLFYFFNRITLPEKLIKSLSHLSFFIFFIHIIVLELSWKYLFVYIFPKNLINLLWFDPLFFVFVSSVSFLTAYLCHQVPKLSQLTG